MRLAHAPDDARARKVERNGDERVRDAEQAKREVHIAS